MKSTYINTRRHSAVNVNTGLCAVKPAPFIQLCVGGWRAGMKVSGELAACDDFKGGPVPPQLQSSAMCPRETDTIIRAMDELHGGGN